LEKQLTVEQLLLKVTGIRRNILYAQHNERQRQKYWENTEPALVVTVLSALGVLWWFGPKTAEKWRNSGQQNKRGGGGSSGGSSSKALMVIPQSKAQFRFNPFTTPEYPDWAITLMRRRTQETRIALYKPPPTSMVLYKPPPTSLVLYKPPSIALTNVLKSSASKAAKSLPLPLQLATAAVVAGGSVLLFRQQNKRGK
jgi:hypothetical protein